MIHTVQATQDGKYNVVLIYRSGPDNQPRVRFVCTEDDKDTAVSIASRLNGSRPLNK